MSALSPSRQPKPKLTATEIQAQIDATGLPLAYIEGYAWFHGHQFRVTPDVLIPRPETEDLVSEAERPQELHDSLSVLDLGTGSGCIGISLKLDHPTWRVTCSDISVKALSIARANAKHLGADIDFVQSDLFANLPDRYHLIASNPPYVDSTWPWIDHRTLDHEPPEALYAPDHGLAIIYKVLDRSPAHLTPNGVLLLEADPSQHAAIIQYARIAGFSHLGTTNYCLRFRLR
jgi:release factor glutamine methyltransferase